MAVGSSRCCRGVLLRVDRLRPSWHWTTLRWNVEQERHRVKREEGDFEQCFPCDKELLRDNSDNTDNFAEAAIFNATITLHTTRQVQQHRPVNFTQAQASTTSTSPVVKVHQLRIYNNQQQHSVKQRHTCVYRLISPMSVGISIHRLISFHTVQT